MKKFLEEYLKGSTDDNAMWLFEAAKKLNSMHQELKPLRQKKRMFEPLLNKE